MSIELHELITRYINPYINRISSYFPREESMGRTYQDGVVTYTKSEEKSAATYSLTETRKKISLMFDKNISGNDVLKVLRLFYEDLSYLCSKYPNTFPKVANETSRLINDLNEHYSLDINLDKEISKLEKEFNSKKNFYPSFKKPRPNSAPANDNDVKDADEIKEGQSSIDVHEFVTKVLNPSLNKMISVFPYENYLGTIYYEGVIIYDKKFKHSLAKNLLTELRNEFFDSAGLTVDNSKVNVLLIMLYNKLAILLARYPDYKEEVGTLLHKLYANIDSSLGDNLNHDKEIKKFNKICNEVAQGIGFVDKPTIILGKSNEGLIARVWKWITTWIKFEYDPESWSIGKTISVTTLLILGMLAVSLLLHIHGDNSRYSFSTALFMNCSDGTQHGQCSTIKPLFCTEGVLINESSKCGCEEGQRPYQDNCVSIIQCSDGTMHPECSSEKKMQCLNGKYVINTMCGCPEGYAKSGEECVKVCSDGTTAGRCSSNKPMYCDNGKLVFRASVCGCNSGSVPEGNFCTSEYKTNPMTVTMKYVLDSDEKRMDFIVFKGLNDYLSGLPRSISYYSGSTPPSSKDFTELYLDNEAQSEFLIKFVDKIRESTPNPDDQVRVAVSLVQHIPYDTVGARTDDLTGRYPYEVLYDNKGVCGEKSKLLAFVLRELGYGVVLFEYDVERHEAVGIKCPIEFDYEGSGYCFIETTRPTIITDNMRDYVGVGMLGAPSEIINISDGKSFDSAQEEFEDAVRFNRIIAKGTVLSQTDYNKWKKLVDKYGLLTS